MTARITNDHLEQWMRWIEEGDHDEALQAIQQVLDAGGVEMADKPRGPWTQEQLRGMYEKGYRHHMTPTSGKFPPLCVKTVSDIAEVMRELYPDDTFNNARISQDGGLLSGRRAGRRRVDDIRVDDVIKIIAGGNPRIPANQTLSAKVLSVLEATNELRVECRKSGRNPWEETWDLSHTQVGLRSRYYGRDTSS